MEYRNDFAGVVLCSQSLRAGPSITYNDRRRTGTETIDFRDCFALSCGRNLNVQSDNKEIPMITSNGGPSRCQLITAPSGYSSTSNSPIGLLSDKWSVTLLIKGWNVSGMGAPRDNFLESK